MGTVKEQLSEEAKEKIQNADVIIAKGMGRTSSAKRGQSESVKGVYIWQEIQF